MTLLCISAYCNFWDWTYDQTQLEYLSDQSEWQWRSWLSLGSFVFTLVCSSMLPSSGERRHWETLMQLRKLSKSTFKPLSCIIVLNSWAYTENDLIQLHRPVHSSCINCMNQTTISHWHSFPWVCSNLQLVQCITTFKNKAQVTEPEFFFERLYQPFCIYICLIAPFRINSETFICKFNSSSQRNPSRLSKVIMLHWHLITINWKRSNPVNGDEWRHFASWNKTAMFSIIL